MKQPMMTTDQIINKAFWLMAIGVISWGVTRFDRITESIETLNNNVAVILTKIAVHDREIQTLYDARFDDNNRAKKREHKED